MPFIAYAKEDIQEPWPREFVTLTVPISNYYHAELSIPNPITKDEFDQLLRVIESFRDGLVEGEND